MSTAIYGLVVTRYPGHDWYECDYYQTQDELREDARKDRVFNLGDPEFEQPDYGLKTADGSIHIVVKAADALADML